MYLSAACLTGGSRTDRFDLVAPVVPFDDEAESLIDVEISSFFRQDVRWKSAVELFEQSTCERVRDCVPSVYPASIEFLPWMMRLRFSVLREVKARRLGQSALCRG
jgi:hypothetical protein